MSTYSILIVDDEPDNFDVIQSLLSRETYTLHYAVSGKHAIASLEKFNPDVILLDVMMPEMNGIEVCKQIKSMSEWQAVPIVMVTALSSKEDLAKCLAAGADDFISKPVSSLELRARVNSMLRVKKQHDRLESFSKLQRYNIHNLASNLNEIRVDLADGFASEFDRPLDLIIDNNNHLTSNFDALSSTAVLDLLETNNRSALQLRKLMAKLWFYLEIVLDKPEPKFSTTANLQPIVDLCIKDKLASLIKNHNISCQIEETCLAVDPTYFQWICNESIEYIANNVNREDRIIIHGETIGEYFNISFTNQQNNDTNYSILAMKKVTESVPGNDGVEKLEIGLKIVKKIVEIYNGLFLISNLDNDGNTIYLTLPLATLDPSLLASPAIVLGR
jgi:two-component system, sensor histidine kinase and response regulator